MTAITDAVKPPRRGTTTSALAAAG